MVRLAINRQSALNPITLRDAIEFELQTQQPRLQSKNLTIELDLATAVASTICTTLVRSALETVLGLAIDRSPRRGELLISGCTTRRGIEIEIADAGEDGDFPRFHAFHRRDCQRLIPVPPNRSDLNCYGAKCPQGGMAWTIILNQQHAISQVA